MPGSVLVGSAAAAAGINLQANFEDIFEGMTLHFIVFSYDELDLFDGENYPPYSISIEKSNESQGEEKLKVKYFY